MAQDQHNRDNQYRDWHKNLTKHSVSDSEGIQDVFPEDALPEDMPPEDVPKESFKLESVSKRLQKAEAAHSAKFRDDEIDASEKPMTSGISLAFRAASELIAAVVVGVALGFWIDEIFDTRPLFLLIMVVVCFTAGVLNTWRVVSGYGSAVGYGAYEAQSTELSQDKVRASLVQTNELKASEDALVETKAKP